MDNQNNQILKQENSNYEITGGELVTTHSGTRIIGLNNSLYGGDSTADPDFADITTDLIKIANVFGSLIGSHQQGTYQNNSDYSNTIDFGIRHILNQGQSFPNLPNFQSSNIRLPMLPADNALAKDLCNESRIHRTNSEPSLERLAGKVQQEKFSETESLHHRLLIVDQGIKQLSFFSSNQYFKIEKKMQQMHNWIWVGSVLLLGSLLLSVISIITQKKRKQQNAS